MKNCILFVREWNDFSLEDFSACRGSDAEGQKDFDALCEWISASDEIQEICKYNPHKKTFRIVKNQVGNIVLPTGLSIQILPKIGSREQAQHLLRDMLNLYFRAKIRVLKTQGAALSVRNWKNPHDALYALFLDECGALVKKGLAREYHEYAEPLLRVRGKINFTRQATQALAVPIHCQFQEYEYNRAENRLLRYCLRQIARFAFAEELRNRAENLLFHFDNISASENPRTDFDTWRRRGGGDGGRELHHYRRVFPIVSMIIKAQHITAIGTGKGVKSFPLAFLYSMDTLFELLIESELKENGISVKPQKRGVYFVSGEFGKSFEFRPDFLLTNGSDGEIVADAKWKIMKPNAKYYGVKRNDLYQLFAYIRYFSPDIHRGILFYPLTDEFSEQREISYTHEGEKLHLLPFDCLNPKRTIDMLKGIL